MALAIRAASGSRLRKPSLPLVLPGPCLGEVSGPDSNGLFILYLFLDQASLSVAARGETLMNPKLMVAISVIAAVPVCAHAQPPSAAKVSRADVQKVLKIISGDKVKTETYCDIAELDNQIDKADEKKDTERADELYRKRAELATTLGPEYAALMDGVQDVDPNSQIGKEIGSVLSALDKLCK
jgi:hypothetical protein